MIQSSSGRRAALPQREQRVRLTEDSGTASPNSREVATESDRSISVLKARNCMTPGFVSGKITASTSLRAVRENVQITIITTCTNRKRRAASPQLQARSLPIGDVNAVVVAWRARLASATDLGVASELYAGRAFQESVQAAKVVGAKLMVVSAGLGLVDAEAQVPAYDLTLAATSEDAVGKKFKGSAADWWLAITDGADPGERLGEGLIVAALSRPYLTMVSKQWANWPQERLARLRLLSKEPPKDVPDVLARAWMPYDDRLDEIAGFAGTQGDFAQRALHHFVKVIGRPSLSVDEHRAAVAQALSNLTPRSIPARDRFDDEAIMALIRRDWDLVGGRSGAMLRHLRDGLLVACEQGRFKLLFKAVAASKLEPSS